VVLQAKWRPITLGMSVLGQALFSIRLLEELGAVVERSVAICRKDDALLHRFATEAHPRLRVWETGLMR
jgi:hypothetical protein